MISNSGDAASSDSFIRLLTSNQIFRRTVRDYMDIARKLFLGN